MDLAGWSVAGGSPVPAVRGGIVSRCELSGRLGRAARVTEVSAATGSGKTLLLLRSWIGEAGLTERAAWVSVQPEERDAQRFSLPVLDALRELTIGEVAAVMDQCSPRALTGICHRSGPCSCLLYRSRLRDPRRTSGRLSAGGGPLSFPGRGACGHEFPLGELILEPLSLDVGVGDGPGEPPRVVPDP